VTKKRIPLAICYDFDGTLAPGNMQERDFIPQIGMDKGAFWDEVKNLAKAHEGDQILLYMKLMLDKAQAYQVTVRRADFEAYGKRLALFSGVYSSDDDNWFTRINDYGDASGIAVQHFVVSSGLREMVMGSPIAKYFSKIYASSFVYDHHGIAVWPALALNYTTKTQYLFRINKGSLDVWDDSTINRYVAHADRPVPFENMIYVGDGLTDIPCFRLVKDQGGHSIAVYQSNRRNAKEQAKTIMKDGRVNFAAPAIYTDGSMLDRIVKGIIDKVSFDTQLRSYGQI
jgi:phosphoserine phosphatase